VGSAVGAGPQHAEVVALPESRPARRGVALRSGAIARGIMVVAGLVGGLVSAYYVARETPLFALRTVEVRGGSPSVARDVRRALVQLSGTSLVTLDAADVERRVTRLPVVRSATVDRDFPHTLVVTVRPERAVALVRQGADSWLLSARGRVLKRLEGARPSGLPRIWVPKRTAVAVGGLLRGKPAFLARAIAGVSGTALARRIRTARSEGPRLTFVLRSGLELRLGEARNLALKLDVARQILSTAAPPAGPGYLDLSDPVHPVAAFSLKSQVEL
jgi:cell division protein FtsQ